MMRHKFAIAALCMLATGVHSITVNPRRNDGTLQRRAEVQFSIGLTLCSWFQGDKFGGSGGSYKQLLVAPGEKEIGCVEMDNSPHVPSDEYQEGEFFNIWNVCGMDIDFYNNDDGDWDFYESGGDGTMLGTCYKHDGKDHYCAEFFQGGTCLPETIMYCYASGDGWSPCNG